MKTKTTKILYWTLTIIFALANFASGIAEFFPNEEGLAVMTLLGYPAYLFIILGIAKILGSIAIIQTKFKAMKEWAYAGFTIDYLGASASFYFVKGDLIAIIFPMIFLGFMFTTYALWKKYEMIKQKLTLIQ